ncbi:MAG: ComF family protein [Pseudomonadota bacterium]
MHQLQRVVSLIYPDQCVLCETRVEQRGGLCAECWRETPFLTGLLCHSCGVSLPGAADETVHCDECLATPRLWEAGRAALSYKGAGRRIVLALKHADRLDLVPPCAEWMQRAGHSFLKETSLIVPVPAHWARVLSRRYNQSLELARSLARCAEKSFAPDALIRTRRTPTQDGKTVEERYANVRDALAVNPRRQPLVSGSTVCLVDDVMTSGATLTVATEGLLEAGATRVFILVLARVEKGP